VAVDACGNRITHHSISQDLNLLLTSYFESLAADGVSRCQRCRASKACCFNECLSLFKRLFLALYEVV
jgi:hypothetical protein